MYPRTISSVPSVEPSLTITHLSGVRLCAIIDLRVKSDVLLVASFYSPGMIST